MAFRVVVAFFSAVLAVISTALIPVAYFGDKNEIWATRLAAIGCVAAVIFLAAWFW